MWISSSPPGATVARITAPVFFLLVLFLSAGRVSAVTVTELETVLGGSNPATPIIIDDPRQLGNRLVFDLNLDIFGGPVTVNSLFLNYQIGVDPADVIAAHLSLSGLNSVIDNPSSFPTLQLISSGPFRPQFSDEDRPVRYALFQSVATSIEARLFQGIDPTAFRGKTISDVLDTDLSDIVEARFNDVNDEILGGSDELRKKVWRALTARCGTFACIAGFFVDFGNGVPNIFALTAFELDRLFDRTNAIVAHGLHYFFEDLNSSAAVNDEVLDFSGYDVSFGGEVARDIDIFADFKEDISDGDWAIDVFGNLDHGLTFDSISLALTVEGYDAIPEPGTAFLFLTGLAVLFSARGRSRQRAA